MSEIEEQAQEEAVETYPIPIELLHVLEQVGEIGFDALKAKIASLREIEAELSKRERDKRRPSVYEPSFNATSPKPEPVGLLDGIQLDSASLRRVIGYYDDQLRAAEAALIYRRREAGYRGFEK